MDELVLEDEGDTDTRVEAAEIARHGGEAEGWATNVFG